MESWAGDQLAVSVGPPGGSFTVKLIARDFPPGAQCACYLGMDNWTYSLEGGGSSYSM
jgi:hypothetical protein